MADNPYAKYVTPDNPYSKYGQFGRTSVSAAPPGNAGFVTDTLHQMTGGLSDKVEALAQTIFGGVPGTSFGDRYHKNLTNTRNDYGGWENLKPGAAYAAKATGVMLPLMAGGVGDMTEPATVALGRLFGSFGARQPAAASVLARTIMQGARAAPTVGGQIGRGALTGGVLGGALGFGGTDDSSFEQDAGATGLGALAGSVMGGALPAMVSAVPAVPRAIQRATAAMRPTSVPDLAGRVLNTARAVPGAPLHVDTPPLPGMRPTLGDASNDRGLQFLQRAVQQGSPEGANLAARSATANNQAITNAISGLGNRNADFNTAIRNVVVSRSPDAAPATQVLQLAQDRLGNGNYYDNIDALARQRKAASDPLYQAAHDYNPVYTDRIKRLIEQPEIKTGINKGIKLVRMDAAANNVPFDPKAYAITDFNAAGDPIIGGVPNMRTLDAGKQGLDAMLMEDSARNPITGRLTTMGRSLTGLRNAYVNELDALNPHYAAARAAWGGPSQTIDAQNMGRDIFKNDPEINAKTIASLSPGDKDFFRNGVMRAIGDLAGKSGDGSSALSGLLQKPYVQQNLTAAFGDKGAADQFIQKSLNILHPEKPIGDILAKDSTGRFVLPSSAVADAIIKPTKTAGAPEALSAFLKATRNDPNGIAALRDGFTNKFLDAVQTNALDQNHNPIVSSAGVSNFLDKYRHIVDSPIFTPPQKAVLQNIQNAADMVVRTTNAKGVGSDTFSKLSGSTFLDLAIGPHATKVVGGLAGLGGALSGHVLSNPAVGALAAAGGYGGATSLMAKLYGARANEVRALVTQAMHDPDLAKALMMRATEGNVRLMKPATLATMYGVLGGQSGRLSGMVFGNEPSPTDRVQ